MSRKVERIDGFLSRLGAIWKTVPDWRFGQLMCNLLGAGRTDPFFIEDTELFDAMEGRLAELVGNPSGLVNNHIEGVLRDEQ